MDKVTRTLIPLLLLFLSQSIHRTGDAIEIRAPQPGDPRPTMFEEKARDTMRPVPLTDPRGS